MINRCKFVLMVGLVSMMSMAGIGRASAQMRWGEGKYGGGEQVIITMKNGDKRALSSVLQNVFDAWTILLGQPLPPIGDY